MRAPDRQLRNGHGSLPHGSLEELIEDRIVEPGRMVMIMGTSTCHMVMAREEREVPGMCGYVQDGILPGFFGYEGHGVTHVLGPLTVDTIVGMGDERDRTTESLARAMAAI